jgi:thioredoxin-like negative regulator of GroEL
MAENLHQVTSAEHFKELLSKDLNRVSLLYFWAPWAEPCKQMNEVIAELSRKYSELLSLQIEAEEQSDIAESFSIESIPVVLLLRVRLLLPLPLPSQADCFLPYPGLRVTHFSPA